MHVCIFVCISDANEGVWVWKFDGNDLFMDPDEPIRFRVENDVFLDVGPVQASVDQPTSPFTIYVRLQCLLAYFYLFLSGVVLLLTCAV
jgi:hypothetical protein